MKKTFRVRIFVQRFLRVGIEVEFVIIVGAESVGVATHLLRSIVLVELISLKEKAFGGVQTTERIVFLALLKQSRIATDLSSSSPDRRPARRSPREQFGQKANLGREKKKQLRLFFRVASFLFLAQRSMSP